MCILEEKGLGKETRRSQQYVHVQGGEGVLALERIGGDSRVAASPAELITRDDRAERLRTFAPTILVERIVVSRRAAIEGPTQSLHPARHRNVAHTELA